MIERGKVKRKPETNLSSGGAGGRRATSEEARMSFWGLVQALVQRDNEGSKARGSG